MKGKIDEFNGKFGFIKASTGFHYFEKGAIVSSEQLDVGDYVEYKFGLTTNKSGIPCATEIKIITKTPIPQPSGLGPKKNLTSGSISIDLVNNLGLIQKYDKKGFGCISHRGRNYYFMQYRLEKSSQILNEGDLCYFDLCPSVHNVEILEVCKIILLSDLKSLSGIGQIASKEIDIMGFINNETNYNVVYNIVTQIRKVHPSFALTKLKASPYFNLLAWIDGIAQYDENIIASFINSVIRSIGYIDKYEKYKEVWAIFKKIRRVNPTFILKQLKGTTYFQVLSWIDGLVQNVELNELVNLILSLIKENNKLIDSNCALTYETILFKIDSEHRLDDLLNLLLKRISCLENANKYNTIKQLLSCKFVNSSLKTKFITAIMVKCDLELHGLLWRDGFSDILDADVLVEKLINLDFTNISGNINRLFSILKDTEQQNDLLKRIGERHSDFDEVSRYSIIIKLFEGNSLSNLAKLNLLHTLFKEYSGVCILDLVHKIYDFYIQSNIIGIGWIETFLNWWSISERLRFLFKITEVLLLQPEKGKYSGIPLVKLIREYPQEALLYLHNNLKLFPVKYHDKIMAMYTGSCKSRHSIYSSNNFDKQLVSIKFLIASPCFSLKSMGSFYSESEATMLSADFVHIMSYAQITYMLNKSLIESFIQIEVRYSLDKIRKVLQENYESFNVDVLLKILRTVNAVDTSVCHSLFLAFKDKLKIYQLIKYWVYDISDYFNFNLYSHYYFVLNYSERSLFNKKARAIMSDELKQSMLKLREPWVLSYEDKENNIEHYEASWKSIWFYDGFIRFCKDSSGNFTTPHLWDFAEEDFNLLFDFLSGKRLPALCVIVQNNKIVRIEGLEALEELIWKIQIRRAVESGNKELRGIGINRIPVNILLRNQCLQLLNRAHSSNYEPIRIIEKNFNVQNNSLCVDISFLYSVHLYEDQVAIIWESLEIDKSKATHIFKCHKDNHSSALLSISEFLQSRPKVRTTLNSSDAKDLNIKKELNYLCRIDHDNIEYNKWENALFEVLPELQYNDYIGQTGPLIPE